MNRRTPLLLLLVALALLVAGCDDSPPVPRAAVRLTLTVDGLLQGYANNYDLSQRLPGTPQEIAETYMRRYQPGPLPRIFEHSVVYDRNGTKLAEWIDEGRRTWMPLNRISPNMVDAILATEDSSFYKNVGVDPHRLLGAILQNASSSEIVSGASTVTMQLARNLFFPTALRYDQSLERKGYEALISQDLTRLYTKDELLEMYLNLIFFGHNAYGVEAAAQTYFGKSAADLTLAEASLLAGIPQAPARYDPFIDFAAAKLRQRTVLNLMVRHAYINSTEADSVFGTALNLVENPDAVARHARHYVQFLREEVQARLGDLQADRAGLHITSTLDLPMQQLAERIVLEQVTQLRPVYDLSNAALVALKPGTAEVLVMVGSANFDDDSIDGKVNVATSLRQPGSAIKPLLYVTAFNDNLISPSTVLWDLRTAYKLDDGQEYVPGNYDERFHGPVTARTALANSYNVPAVKLLDAVGVDRMLEVARALGVKSLADDPSRYGLSLTLGGGDVRLLDLATAYHTIANGGAYIPYQPVLSIDDGAGRPVALFPAANAEQVVTPQAAFLATSIMSDYRARVPAFGQNPPLNLSRPAAAKTGTTTSFRDNLTMGFTRYLVAGVWAGNSDGRIMRGVTGITGAAPIWNQFMEAVIADPQMRATLGAPETSAGWEFLPPDGVELAVLDCPRSLNCTNPLEFYSRAWMAKQARTGVQSDTVLSRDRVASVLANGRVVGVCSDPNGAERTHYRLPEGMGRLSEFDFTEANMKLAIAPGLPFPEPRAIEVRPVTAVVPEQIEAERREVLRWAAQNGEIFHLGPCTDAAPVVAEVFGTANISFGRMQPMAYNLPAIAGDTLTATLAITPTRPLTTTPPIAESDAVTDTEETERQQISESEQVAEVVIQPEPVPPPASGSGQYLLGAAGPSGGCSGNYIMGAVYDPGGAPVAGVRVVAVDAYGNRAETVSKNGAGDYGMFDFQVSGTTNSYYITIVDGSGNSAGATAVIAHQQPGEGNACYWVQFQAAY